MLAPKSKGCAKGIDFTRKTAIKATARACPAVVRGCRLCHDASVKDVCVDRIAVEMKPLIAGNWKMHGVAASIVEFDRMVAGYDPDLRAAADLMICPPATLLARLAERTGASGIAIGGQDCHFEPNGAHTGSISAEMIHDAGGTSVILGHSERRSHHRESNELIAAKARAALSAGLIAIVCIGETEGERQAGKALDVVATQLTGSVPPDFDPARLVIAYEPVWAIGTGVTPTTKDVEEMHAHIRAQLVQIFGASGAAIRILYGGSVKPGNARELLDVADVGGALVGGASLKAADFLGIAQAAIKPGA
jgi:triosephosphate isomerase